MERLGGFTSGNGGAPAAHTIETSTRDSHRAFVLFPLLHLLFGYCCIRKRAGAADALWSSWSAGANLGRRRRATGLLVAWCGGRSGGSLVIIAIAHLLRRDRANDFAAILLIAAAGTRATTRRRRLTHGVGRHGCSVVLAVDPRINLEP